MNRSTLLLIVICGSCGKPVSQREVAGTYVYNYTDLTKDSLFVRPNGTYQQRIYSARTRDLLHQNRGRWKLMDNHILLFDFMLNQHADIETNGFNQINTSLPVTRGLTEGLRLEEGETVNGGEGYYVRQD